jgi:hypothetical protein
MFGVVLFNKTSCPIHRMVNLEGTHGHDPFYDDYSLRISDYTWSPRIQTCGKERTLARPGVSVGTDKRSVSQSPIA